MSEEKIKITIRCSRKVKYHQDFLVTAEQLAILKKQDLCDVFETSDLEAYSIIEQQLDGRLIHDAESIYLDFEIVEIDAEDEEWPDDEDETPVFDDPYFPGN